MLESIVLLIGAIAIIFSIVAFLPKDDPITRVFFPMCSAIVWIILAFFCTDIEIITTNDIMIHYYTAWYMIWLFSGIGLCMVMFTLYEVGDALFPKKWI